MFQKNQHHPHGSPCPDLMTHAFMTARMVSGLENSRDILGVSCPINARTPHNPSRSPSLMGWKRNNILHAYAHETYIFQSSSVCSNAHTCQLHVGSKCGPTHDTFSVSL